MSTAPLPVQRITTVSDWEVVRPALCAAPILGVDTETTGLDPHTDKLRLVQFATTERAIVVDVEQVSPLVLADVFAAQHVCVFHNAKFDLQFLHAAGLSWPKAHILDTMLAGQVLDAGLDEGLRHTLAAMAERFLAVHVDKTAQMSDWRGPLSDAQLAYAAYDAQLTLALGTTPALGITANDLRQACAIEWGCVPALAWLEWTGVPFAGTVWDACAQSAVATVTALEQALTACLDATGGTGLLFNVAFKWGSPVEVRTLLQQRGHAVTSTGDEVLASLGTHDPLIPLLRDYREASKKVATYGAAWAAQAVHAMTRRVHATYRQLGSRAGRMSCSKPNMQQVPRTGDYRRAFHAAPGRCLVKADYSQIELRLAALLAQDTAMLAAYREGQDLHITTASRVLGVAVEAVTGPMRQIAKSLNFGLLYGMGAESLQAYALTTFGVALSPAEAQQYRRQFFAQYPGIQAWQTATMAEHGTETRTMAGRRRLDVQDFTQLLNSPVQGTGADGLKWALARLYTHQDEAPDAVLVAVVHDEVVAECPIEAAEQTAAWLERHMVTAMYEVIGDGVPVVVDTTIGHDWAGSPLEPALAAV